ASAWVADVRASPEVQGVVELPQAREGERLLAVTLAPDASGGFGSTLASVSKRARATRPAGQRVLASGAPAAQEAIAEALQVEQRRIVPIVCALLLGLLAFLYRSVVLALAAVLPALSGIALTAAVQVGIGYAIDPVSSLLAPVLLVVGV